MKKAFFFALAAALLGASISLASDTGSISGVVTDQNGAVVPDVTVTARNTSTGIERTVVTNAQGVYALPNLAIGTYDLTFTKEGFKELRQTGLVVDVTAEVRQDVVRELRHLHVRSGDRRTDGTRRCASGQEDRSQHDHRSEQRP